MLAWWVGATWLQDQVSQDLQASAIQTYDAGYACRPLPESPLEALASAWPPFSSRMNAGTCLLYPLIHTHTHPCGRVRAHTKNKTYQAKVISTPEQAREHALTVHDLQLANLKFRRDRMGSFECSSPLSGNLLACNTTCLFVLQIRGSKTKKFSNLLQTSWHIRSLPRGKTCSSEYPPAVCRVFGHDLRQRPSVVLLSLQLLSLQACRKIALRQRCYHSQLMLSSGSIGQRRPSE